MPVRRRKFKRRDDITETQYAYLMDEPWPVGSEDSFHRWLYEWPLPFDTGCAAYILWDENKHWALPKYVEQKPGRRPKAWWLWDAPRSPPGTYPGCYYDERLCEPRKRLGGVGTPMHECLSVVPTFSYGVPHNWLTPDLASLYRGTAKDIHGDPIFPDYFDNGFSGAAIDPANPPMYESQATYLNRHGLFHPGEAKRLTKRDFEAEVIH